jgi:hypothetical protein
MQADGSGLTAVPGSGPLDTLYGWAPDGRWLLVESSWDVNAEIYAAAPDGGQWVNLTSDRAQDQRPSWSPDGTKIAFVSDRGGDPGRFVNQVYLLEIATGQVKRLTDERYGATAPTWSPVPTISRGEPANASMISATSRRTSAGAPRIRVSTVWTLPLNATRSARTRLTWRRSVTSPPGGRSNGQMQSRPSSANSGSTFMHRPWKWW